jgi:hypothetical protein
MLRQITASSIVIVDVLMMLLIRGKSTALEEHFNIFQFETLFALQQPTNSQKDSVVAVFTHLPIFHTNSFSVCSV